MATIDDLWRKGDLPITDLRLAGDTIETVIEFRAYLPPGEHLVVFAGSFRDDIRELLGMPELGVARRGTEVKPLSEMNDEDFGTLCQAVAVLLGQFTVWMDDPELVILLNALHDLLTGDEARRDALKEAERRANLNEAELKEEVTVL
jgi:hypothetical protein